MINLISIAILINIHLVHIYKNISIQIALKAQELNAVLLKLSQRQEINTKIVSENITFTVRSGDHLDDQQLFTKKTIDTQYFGRDGVKGDNEEKIENSTTNKPYQGIVHNTTSYFLSLMKKICQSSGRRAQVKQYFRKHLSEANSELITALLIGKSNQVNPVPQEILRKSGVSYIFNVPSLFYSVIYLSNSLYIWKRFGKNFTTLLCVLLLFFLISLSSCSFSTLRTYLGLVGLLLAKSRGYRVHTLWLVFLTLLILLAFDKELLSGTALELYLAFRLSKVLFTKLSTNISREKIDTSSNITRYLNYQSTRSTANGGSIIREGKQRAKQLINDCKKLMSFLFIVQLTLLLFSVWMFRELTINLLVIVPFILSMLPLMTMLGVTLFVAEFFHLHTFCILSAQLINFCLHTFLQLIQTSAQLSLTLSGLTYFDIFCVTSIYISIVFYAYFNQSQSKKIRNESWLLCR